MGFYFDDNLSVATKTDGDAVQTLEVVAKHYMEMNPRGPVTVRPYSTRGIQRAGDYRHDVNFNTIFPDAQDEQCVFAWSKIHAGADSELLVDINCYGPIIVYVNGEKAWNSDHFSERDPSTYVRVGLKLKEGWNNVLIRAKKTCGGFGWTLGSWIGKHPSMFMMPSADREGQEGWLFTDPVSSDVEMAPAIDETEEATGIHWYPSATWTADELAMGNCARIYGQKAGEVALGWTKIKAASATTIEMSGSCKGAVKVLCNGNAIFAADASGDVSATFDVEAGEHDIMVLSTGAADGWGFELAFAGVETDSPFELNGSNEAWLFGGPYNQENLPDLEAVKNVLHIQDTVDGAGYWRLDLPDTYLRLYNENPLFGHWHYPLGVTLYGLMHAGLTLDSDEIKSYVQDHVQRCCDSWSYAQWDCKTFAGTSHILDLLTGIDSLDDCGSFASTMLEVAKFCEIKDYKVLADLTADYIFNVQDRFEDGAFQRKEMMHHFHNGTMWADDLYMSTPFLIRYYQLTGEQKYIDDAANQFFGFKKRLWIPEQRVMSHVYDINRELATGVPWGRGNGWTLFSLTELLQVLPEDHEKRDDLLAFYREMAEGILELQGPDDMWHQVLTHHESYPETSCTAMFISAFSRGIRNGWLEKPKKYIEAANRAWKRIAEISVDVEGNVHGVCRGSEFSFTPDYYINDLLWRLNDTHGIGIVMLAAVELNKLNEFQGTK